MTMKGDVRLDPASDGTLLFEDIGPRSGLGPRSALTVFDRSVTSPAVAPRRRIFQHRGRNDSIASGQPVAAQHGNDLRMDTASATLGCLARADRGTERVQEGPPERMSRALGG